MKLFLAFVVCFVSLVDVSLAANPKCYVCSGCATTLTGLEGSATQPNCRTVITVAATTDVTVAREAVATCADTSADFALGKAATLSLCTTTDSGNNDIAFAAKSIGCYACTDPAAPACLDPAANSGVKAFDNTVKEAGRGCSIVATYAAGKLTTLVRARGVYADCKPADTSATGDGTKTVCCNDKLLCNDAVIPATIVSSTVKPAAVVPKHAPKNIMNAFVLISAVILAVVSK